jgi:hypothetical protein
MIGRFHELSLHSQDIGGAWQRWLSLGFAAGEAGDVWRHPYGVVACEGLAIGLHATADEPLCITFVRPGVEEFERELSDRLIGVERAQLGADVFNMLELREPGGVLLRVLEARSFSPPGELPRETALGSFRTLSLPCTDFAEVRAFWERLDMEVEQIEQPWEGLHVAGLPIAHHDGAVLDNAVLVFDEARHDIDNEALRESLLGTGRILTALRGMRHRMLRTPEHLALLLLDQTE